MGGRAATTLKLTQREADVVWIALLSVADDLDDYFPNGRDRAAFGRVLGKFRIAFGYRH